MNNKRDESLNPLPRSNESGSESPAVTAWCDSGLEEWNILSTTESVCPVCLSRLPARRVARGDHIYLEKDCPEHGSFRTIIWRGEPAFSSWTRPKIPASPKKTSTRVEQGCPFDCGLCPDHRQQPCCVLLDVTQRCDLSCTFCFASAGNKNKSSDPPLETIKVWFQRLMDAGGPFNIQLSGGEPCLRDDLPEIIALGRAMGFTFFQVNTNGLRLARDEDFLHRLKEAGLSTVYLQFDGTKDEIYQKMRGGRFLKQKIQTIENCAREGLGVVLVPTLVPGVNTSNIGDILRLALEHVPTIRGVHFQPVSYFGRYPQPPSDAERFTLPEVISAIEEQTNGRIKKECFKPSGAENALCSFHGNFVLMPDGELKPLTHHEPDQCCCTPPERADEGSRKSRLFTARSWSAPKLDLPNGQAHILKGWDDFLTRVQTYSFTISCMTFQDAWNLDLERLHDCHIIQVSPDGLLVPFCAYNLTNQEGHSLYRPG
jgi:uncharacterized radical SAM superfamily Fe-S cluster-containing enzyme